MDAMMLSMSELLSLYFASASFKCNARLIILLFSPLPYLYNLFLFQHCSIHQIKA
jgi:hypothetical protein